MYPYALDPVGRIVVPNGLQEQGVFRTRVLAGSSGGSGEAPQRPFRTVHSKQLLTGRREPTRDPCSSFSNCHQFQCQPNIDAAGDPV